MTTVQTYQAAFTAHLRNPAAYSPPAGVSRQRMRVYRDIVFNNFLASVSACFPVLRDILGKRRFSQLVRQCFFSQHFQSPLFQEIPASFVNFLQKIEFAPMALPDYTAQLAHYEWIELALSRQIDPAPDNALAETNVEVSDLLHRVVRLTTVHRLLAYDFPVHQLSKKYPACAPAATFLLVYRTPQFQIRFVQVNALTYQLLQALQASSASAHTHLQNLAHTLSHLALPSVIDFGLQTLHSLQLQGAITVDTQRYTSHPD